MPPPRSKVGRVDPAIRCQLDPPGLDAKIARVGERQSGVIGRGQLLALGASGSGIDRRLQAARLHPLHRGVYAIGHRNVDRRGRWLAALIACGPGALLSHRCAAVLWDLARPRGARIDVTIARRSGRVAPGGVALHRVRSLPAEEVAANDGIPCTSVARTLHDLAGSASRRELERACERAEMLALLDVTAIDATLRRGSGRRGGRALRALLREWDAASTRTRSELEERFLSLIRAAGLPQPRLNVNLLIDGGRRHVEVDAVWVEQRLVVELDGRAVHGTREAFERDRDRDVALMCDGYRVARFTWRRIVEQPWEVARAVSELLGLGPLRPGADRRLRRSRGRRRRSSDGAGSA